MKLYPPGRWLGNNQPFKNSWNGFDADHPPTRAAPQASSITPTIP
jgi:hypothetical protein